MSGEVVVTEHQVDAALDAWFGNRAWRSVPAAHDMRQLWRRQMRAALVAAAFQERRDRADEVAQL